MESSTRKRVIENAPGDFYVEAGVCAHCCMPHGVAPELMNDAKVDFRECYFRRQPQTPEEVKQAIEALQVSDLGCLRYGGNNPYIIDQLYHLHLERQCDHSPKPAAAGLSAARFSAMGSDLLSPHILAKASLVGTEYAWPSASVEEAIQDARHHCFATIGGQAQFRLPDATCEMYWIDIDPKGRSSKETWREYVDRSAAEAIQKFRDRLTNTNWPEQIAWKELIEKQAQGVDILSSLYFVLYFTPLPPGPWGLDEGMEFHVGTTRHTC